MGAPIRRKVLKRLRVGAASACLHVFLSIFRAELAGCSGLFASPWTPPVNDRVIRLPSILRGDPTPRGRSTSSGLPPTRWSPRRSTLDSEVGASALAVGIQFPLTPASLSRSRWSRRDGGGAHPSTGDQQLPAQVTDRRSLALASHRQSSSQLENHASGESRKRRRSSGLRPMARPDPVKESEEGSKEERVAQRPQLPRPVTAVPPQPPADAPSSSRLTGILRSPLDSCNRTFGRCSQRAHRASSPLRAD
jgi:hypothetical protein